MIHALHGNSGLPDDLLPLLHATGRSFRAWHLWQWLAEHQDAASFDGIAAALREAADESPRMLIGYSLGARLALHALTQQPGAWDAAILISAHPGLRNETERAARLAHDEAWAARFRRDPWPEVMRDWNEQPVLAGGAVPPHSAESWRREVAQGFEVWSLGRQEDLRPLLPRVSCPVLWLTGERDAKFTALAAECCALLPNAEHVIVPGAGHRVHVDRPDAACAWLKARPHC